MARSASPSVKRRVVRAGERDEQPGLQAPGRSHSRRAEQLVGNEGFTGPASLLYHIRPPTTVKAVRRVRDIRYERDPDQTLRHRHFLTARLPVGGSPTLDRVPLLFNQDVAMLFARPDREDAHWYRNSMGDEIVYVSQGSGVLETQFGDLPYREGDYLVIHRHILHRYRMAAVEHRLLIMESRGYVRTPRRYRTDYGQLVEGAPFSERDIRRPAELRTHDEVGDFPILVKQYDGLTKLVLDHHPCDVIGWDGYFYPWAFNIQDFEPLVGRIHQPPPVHQTFAARNFVVCSFVPSLFDYHPEGIPAPYNHSTSKRSSSPTPAAWTRRSSSPGSRRPTPVRSSPSRPISGRGGAGAAS